MSKRVREQNAQQAGLIPDSFEICAVKYLFPSFPLNPKRHIIFENILQNSQGQQVWHRLLGWLQTSNPVRTGASSGEAALAAFHFLNGV